MHPPKQNWQRLRTFPLSDRKNLTWVEDILLDPDAAPPALSGSLAAQADLAAQAVRQARAKGAGVILMYGAHLLRNGAARILDRMMANGWVTHLATNGAGTIHDWEYAWLGRSTESVEENVATGTFGTWDETGRNLHIAMMAGALNGEGYGVSLGRFIAENGCTLPTAQALETAIATEPSHPLTAARADLLQAMRTCGVPGGSLEIPHRWPQASILASAFSHKVPLTVHPGIGYDIIANHPMFNGAVIGRGAGMDFRLFCDSVDTLDGGVVLSIGSAIMAPQVFEKALSCVHNLRIQDGRPLVQGHSIFVVDLQDGGGWDWLQGEPPKTNPAYYLRFCKSFSRMGGAMHYVQCDNAAFVQNLAAKLGDDL